jgi:hypothetical protein
MTPEQTGYFRAGLVAGIVAGLGLAALAGIVAFSWEVWRTWRWRSGRQVWASSDLTVRLDATVADVIREIQLMTDAATPEAVIVVSLRLMHQAVGAATLGKTVVLRASGEPPAADSPPAGPL